MTPIPHNTALVLIDLRKVIDHPSWGERNNSRALFKIWTEIKNSITERHGLTKNILLFAAVLQTATSAQVHGQQDTARLKFSDFRVAEEFRKKPAAVDLGSDPQARTYRTMLRGGARSGPNFAGHFTIVIWGCGAACQQFAIVDASSGKVFFSKEVPYVSFGDWSGEPYGLEFRRGSRLLAVYGHIKEDEPKGIFFFTWDGTQLTLIKSIPKQ